MVQKSLLTIGCVALLLTSACQDYSFETLEEGSLRIAKMVETVGSSGETDIVVVVDNSESMKEEQDALILSSTNFIKEIADSGTNFRIAIVTTDPFNDAQAGWLQMVRDPNPDCALPPSDPNGPPFLESPDPDSPTAAAQRCRLVADFRSTVLSLSALEGPGRGSESGLLTAWNAVRNSYLSPQGSLTSFLRRDADLALIFLTDEDDCSFDDYSTIVSGSSCYTERQLAIDPARFVDEFVALKGDVKRVRAALIGGGTYRKGEFSPSGCYPAESGSEGVDCGCWGNADFSCDLTNAARDVDGEKINTQCARPGSCSPVYGKQKCKALPAYRYHDFVKELEARRLQAKQPRGIFEDSVCKASYEDTLLNIAEEVVLSQCFSLSTETADSDSLVLRMSRFDPSLGRSTESIVPRHHPADLRRPDADCANEDGAWYYRSPSEICLTCGLRKRYRDTFTLALVTENSFKP